MRKKSFLRIFTAFCLPALLSAPLHAQRGNPEMEFAGRSVDEMIAAFMREQDVPGMAVAIVQAPYITRVTGYGVGDLEKHLLASSHTLFDIGQMAEAYLAVAAMQLVESGKIKLDAPIGDYVPNTPAAWAAVTIRQLLHHQSGISDYKTVKGFESDKNASSGELIASVADLPLAFPPGTRVSPSATDYLLLTMAIEKASGQSCEAFVRQNQFDRLGLRYTHFSSELEKIPRENPGASERHGKFLHEPQLINPTEPATGYRKPKKALLPVKADPSSRCRIYSSAMDISLWDIGLAGDILIKDASLRKILYQPGALSDGRGVPSSGPWFFPGHPGLMVATGSDSGFSSLLSRFTRPDELVCVTLLANKEGVDLTQLARRIAGAYNPKIGPPPQTAAMRTQQSPYPVKETIDRLEQILRDRGVAIIARVDHAKAAKSAELDLPPTEELIFGNPAVGTLLMQSNPAVAVDLPLRAAAWEQDGQVWLAAVDPMEIVRRNHITDRDEVALRMREAIDSALHAAVSAD